MSKNQANRPDSSSKDSVFQLAGPDSLTFLQGQTTVDFKTAEFGSAILGAFCNNKGRVLADFLAVVVNERTVLLRGRAHVLKMLSEYLSPYLGFSKCDLTQINWGVSVFRDQMCTSSRLDSRVELDFDKGQVNEVRIRRGPTYREVWCKKPEVLDLGTRFGQESNEADVLMGIARIEPETCGAYLPQDLNYDLNGHVSFNKGCYTGQEIIARLHYRGTPKRRLYRAQFPAQETCPVSGGKILEIERNTVGSVVNAERYIDNWELLIEIKPAMAEEILHLEKSDQKLSVLEPCHSGSLQSTSDRS